jgi:serine phosphatase RsbU (regulator of sigma subunit)
MPYDSAYWRRYYQEHKEEIKARMKRNYYTKHGKKVKDDYYRDHLKEKKAYQKEHYRTTILSKEQLERRRAQSRAYYWANREQIREQVYMKKYVDVMSDFITSLEAF